MSRSYRNVRPHETRVYSVAEVQALSDKAESAKAESARARNLNIALWGTTAAVATLAVSYLAVPLYKMFCQASKQSANLTT